MPMCLSRTLLYAAILSATSFFATTCSVAARCSSDDWKPPANDGGTGVQGLLKAIQPGTKWADLPDTVKSELQRHADNRLAAYRARWAAPALASKETILQDCPTSAMSAALDEFYRKSYDTILPATFALSEVKSDKFRRALVRGYLLALAAWRATTTYPTQKYPNHDWDGVSTFDSVRLPDQKTYEDTRALGAALVSDLRAIDSSALSDVERKLKEDVLFVARATAEGAFNTDSKGGFDRESACEMIALDGDVLDGYQADRGRPVMFASDDAVLREINAIYLPNISLKWLDVGTWNSAINLGLCNWSDGEIDARVGNPGTNEIAKGMTLLKAWWVERTSKMPAVRNKCSIYQAADRAQIWDAFSADQHFNNDNTSSMESYQSQVDAYAQTKVKQYRQLSKLAVNQVFPDSSVLTDDQRTKVLASIESEISFGQLRTKIAAALDAAQETSGGPAASRWNSALNDNVMQIGGYADGEDIRPDDEVLFKEMFAEVKTWVAKRYVGYPIPISQVVGKVTFILNTSGGAETNQSNGTIRFGIGTKRSKMEYYSLLLHELRHAVVGAWLISAPDKSQVVSDMGTAVEGSGVAAEELLVRPFMQEKLQNDAAYALYALDYGLRDARFTATTQATLKKYLRSDCTGDGQPDTIDFVKRIAEEYGLTGPLAATVALRSHAGTQYFQYISAGVQVLDDIDYLQGLIDPSRQHMIDPYILFSCGLNNPARDVTYVAKLKACMKL